MGKPLIIAGASGFVALIVGLLMGFALQRMLSPSPSQSISTHLEEQVNLAVGSDNRQHPAQHQVESLANLVGQRIIEAAEVYPQADAASRARIQRNIERVLHAGLLQHIPYADKRARSMLYTECLRTFQNDMPGLSACIRKEHSFFDKHNPPLALEKN